MITGGVGVFVYALRELPAASAPDATLWFLAAMVVFGQFLAWSMPGGDERQEMSFTVPFGLALFILHGLVVAVVVEAVAAVVGDVARRKPALKIAFNASMNTLGLGLAAGILSLFGYSPAMPAQVGPGYLTVLFAAGVAYLTWTHVAVTTIIALTAEPLTLREWARRSFGLASLLSSGLLVVLAPLIVAAAERGPWVMALPAVPVLLTEVLIREAHRRRYEATHDTATGMPNLAGFGDALDDLEERGADDVTVLAVRVASLDEHAETMGSEHLNALLAGLAARLEETTPGGHYARTSDDTFMTAVEGADGRLAETLTNVLAEPLRHGAFSFVPECTVGEARWPDHAEHARELPEHARTAAVEAARDGALVRRYAPGTEAARQQRLALLADLGEAIRAGQLRCWYQPKVALADNAVVGFEALARWHHPARGLVFPDEFVPLAECTVLVDPLAEAILRAALADLAAWRADGYDLHIAVNVSVRNLVDDRFPDAVAAILDETGLPSDALELEVTESAMASDLDAVRKVLERLRHEVGVRLALDDFGTGYSSLTHLRLLPFDVIKLDKSFVMDLEPGGPQVPFVQALRQLGGTLDREMVAEGIETEAARDLLTEFGYHTGQGYWISRPLPVEEATAWLEARVVPPATDGSARAIARGERSDLGGLPAILGGDPQG